MTIANFIIAGVPKAGTSSVHRWIAAHPDAVGSTEKETYHFADPGTHMARDGVEPGDLDAYARHFPVEPGREPKVVLESTPGYVYHREALLRIPGLPTQPRCLFIVREPSSQVFSLYRYFRENWSWVPASMSFREFVAAVRGGTHDFGGNELAFDALSNAAYVDFLEPWRERLGGERMRVHTFDALKADPRGFVEDVAGWLGLDTSFYQTYGFPRENETYAARWRSLQEVNIALRARLPKGWPYEVARRVYRAVNTRSPDAAGSDERAVLSGLRDEYRAANERLARSFDLDLSGW